MKKRVLRREVLYVIYGLVVIALIATVYFVEKAFSNSFFKGNDDGDYEYVSRTVFDDTIPVVSTTGKLIRPYLDENVKILRGFYDYKDEAPNQEKSLIYYADQYLQNSGVAYGADEVFDVVAIYDGFVIDVREDNLFGKVVEVRHSNDLISVYQGLSEVVVKKDDEIKQKTVIGKSGTSNINKDLNNHLHFELIYKGEAVNPEQYYEKEIGQLE